MKKLLVIVCALGAYAMLCADGPSVLPQGGGHAASACVGLALCLPVLGFFMLFRGFHAWHRAFHTRMLADGFRGRRAGE